MMRLTGSSSPQPIQYPKVRLVENTCPNMELATPTQRLLRVGRPGAAPSRLRAARRRDLARPLGMKAPAGRRPESGPSGSRDSDGGEARPVGDRPRAHAQLHMLVRQADARLREGCGLDSDKSGASPGRAGRPELESHAPPTAHPRYSGPRATAGRRTRLGRGSEADRRRRVIRSGRMGAVTWGDARRSSGRPRAGPRARGSSGRPRLPSTVLGRGPTTRPRGKRTRLYVPGKLERAWKQHGSCGFGEPWTTGRVDDGPRRGPMCLGEIERHSVPEWSGVEAAGGELVRQAPTRIGSFGIAPPGKFRGRSARQQQHRAGSTGLSGDRRTRSAHCSIHASLEVVVSLLFSRASPTTWGGDNKRLLQDLWRHPRPDLLSLLQPLA